MPNSTDISRIELTPLQRDILKLIRRTCYKGLPETRTALVDSTDPRLVKWDSSCPKGSFSLPSGCPELLIRACVLAVPQSDAETRWGKDGFNPDPSIQYLIDRGFLKVSRGSDPFVAAFENPLNDGAEVRFTKRIEKKSETREVCVWETPVSTMVVAAFVLHNGHIVGEGQLPDSVYRTFQLTERGLALLDAEHSSARKRGKASKRRKRKPRTVPTSKQFKALALRLEGLSFDEIGKRLGISQEAARKRVLRAEKIHNVSGRSVRATQDVPTDRRGQGLIEDGREIIPGEDSGTTF